MKSYKALAAIILITLTASACGTGSSPTSQRKPISHVIQRMLSAQKVVVPFSQTSSGTSPSAAQTQQLTSMEIKALRSIFVAHSQVYRQNLRAFQAALSEASQTRCLGDHITQFQLVSLEVNGSNASAEWTALRTAQITSRVDSTHWSQPSKEKTPLEGTSILTRRGDHWYISSTTGTP